MIAYCWRWEIFVNLDKLNCARSVRYSFEPNMILRCQESFGRPCWKIKKTKMHRFWGKKVELAESESGKSLNGLHKGGPRPEMQNKPSMISTLGFPA